MGVAIGLFLLILVAIKVSRGSGLGLSELLDPTFKSKPSSTLGTNDPVPEGQKSQTATAGNSAYEARPAASGQMKKDPIVARKELMAAHRETATMPENMRKEAPVSKLMDDREHDWLAGQLRDERVAKKRMSDMFDLKVEHSHNCEAEMLRSFHAANCDAEGIDTAGA